MAQSGRSPGRALSVGSVGFVGALVALALVALACDRRPVECASLVKVVNPAMARMTKATAAHPEAIDARIAQALEIAAIEKSTADQLAAVPLTVPPLVKFSADYQAMAREVAAAATQTADMLKSARKAHDDAQKADHEADEAGARLVKGCAAAKDPRDVATCKSTEELIKAIPDDLSTAPDLEQTAASLEKITFADPELAGTGKGVASALRNTRKALLEAREVDAKARAAKLAYDTAARKEDPLVDGVNKLCMP